MDKINQNIDERRKNKRVTFHLPLQYRNLRKIGVTSLGSLTKDISEGGVRFNSSEFISLACRLVVEITLPTSTKPIKAISKVAWIRKLPTTSEYELGNQFLEMSKEDKDLVMNFVNRAVIKNS
ncbi:MAG: PilZ domain-containing protein [Candidatus Omnitrophota bacterium]